jgi:hypothetical protein
MQNYLTAFANRCRASLPPNKVEMTSRKCATESVTRNGFGQELSRTCVEWVNVPNGLFADPGLYEAKKQLDRRVAANTTLGSLLSTTNETLSRAKAAPSDMARFVGMNACGGPGLRRFGENLRRFALDLAPIKVEGYAFSLQDLEQSRDPERFAHFLLWGMSPYGSLVYDRPDYPESFEGRYTLARETFNALAKVNGREKMIATAKRILDAPKTRHPSGLDAIADPPAIGCTRSFLYSCYAELVTFLPPPARTSSSPAPAAAATAPASAGRPTPPRPGPAARPAAAGTGADTGAETRRTQPSVPAPPGQTPDVAEAELARQRQQAIAAEAAARRAEQCDRIPPMLRESADKQRELQDATAKLQQGIADYRRALAEQRVPQKDRSALIAARRTELSRTLGIDALTQRINELINAVREAQAACQAR